MEIHPGLRAIISEEAGDDALARIVERVRQLEADAFAVVSAIPEARGPLLDQNEGGGIRARKTRDPHEEGWVPDTEYYAS